MKAEMETRTEHTPGPLVVTSKQAGEYVVFLDKGDCPTVATATIADARRIVAAVNATEGIPTEALEDGAVSELLEAAEDALAAFEHVNERVEISDDEVDLPSKLRDAIAKATGGAE